MTFPVPPLNAPDKNSRVWHLWFDNLRRFLSDASGLIPWASVNKSGAKLTDIPERFHNTLQVIQGGAADDYYHLTVAQLTDLTDSGVTTLHTHTHNLLDSLQGGVATEYYHATAAEYAELQRSDNVTESAVNISLDDTRRTVLMTASGKTVTLPAASAARIGKDWTVILGIAGYTDIARAGADTLTLPTNDTTIRLDNKGASITLRCLTASSWGIA